MKNASEKADGSTHAEIFDAALLASVEVVEDPRIAALKAENARLRKVATVAFIHLDNIGEHDAADLLRAALIEGEPQP